MNGGIKYVFTMIDSFSKCARCTPSLTKSGAAFLNALKDLHKRKGTWKIFHSDNEGEFTSNAVQEYIANRMQTKSVHRAPYRPQSFGQIERFNRTLKSRIRRFLGPKNRNWVFALDDIVFQYNIDKHKATNVSPLVLFKCHDPINLNCNFPDELFKIQRVRNHFAKYVENYRRAYDARINLVDLIVENRVLSAREFNPKFKKRSHAFESYYFEETYIIRFLNNDYALIYNEANTTQEKRVHKTLLLKLIKKYYFYSFFCKIKCIITKFRFFIFKQDYYLIYSSFKTKKIRLFFFNKRII
ncbi:Gag-Pol polyprotein [Cucumispora dikerogammari]|nr:Gag-Pol polyprotein [Cucumispora dikerogammari]